MSNNCGYLNEHQIIFIHILLMKTFNVLYVEPCLTTLIIFYFLLLLSIPISFIMVIRMIIYEGVAIELFTPPLRDQCDSGPHNLATLIAYGQTII